jgi:hypothetical protein
MALQGTIPEMISKRDTTIGTFKGKTTIRAEDKIGESPSVEEEQALFFISDVFLKGRSYPFRQKDLFISHIHHFHVGKRFSFDPFRECQETNFPYFGITE